jgi:Co/Zn/Cd efflux system component
VAKRDVTDKIRQRVVETLRISGDDEFGKGRPIYGYFTFWYISILFFLWSVLFILPPGIGVWYVANIIEGFVEPVIESGGLFIAAAIGLIVDFVFVVRGWIRRKQQKEE